MPQDKFEPTDEMKQQALEEAAERQKAAKGIQPGRKRPDKYKAEGLTPDAVKSLMPFYIDIGPKPFGIGPKRWKWSWKKHKERKKLRTDLKKNYGIKKRREFEEIARQVGLGIENRFLGWLFMLPVNLLSAGTLMTLIGSAALILTSLFAYSYIQEQVGSFTIQLNPSTMKSGFVLSDTAEFETKTARLISEEMVNVNAITVTDIATDVDESEDGPHNGKYYIAYTFYIRNDGDKEASYEYTLVLGDSILGAEKAVWCMLFEDGHQVIYAIPSEDGDEERLSGYYNPPFKDCAYNESQYYQREDGKWGISTTPAIDDHNIAKGIVEHVKPGEFHKYTVVIWLEGNDPECVDDIMDGFAKYYMEFDTLDDSKRSLFEHVYRKEYDMNAPISSETEAETEETSGQAENGETNTETTDDTPET